MGLADYSSLGVSPREFVDGKSTQQEMPLDQDESDIDSLGLSPADFIDKNEKQDVEEEESYLKSGVRTALQPVKALAYRFAGVPNLVLEGAKALSSATAGAEVPEDIRELQAQYPEQSEEIERNFREGAKNAVGYLPSVSTGMELLEKAGIPTEAKTRFQKGVNVASLGALGLPGMTASEATTSGIVSETLYEYLKNIDIPDQVAEGIALLVGGLSSHQQSTAASLGGRKVTRQPPSLPPGSPPTSKKQYDILSNLPPTTPPGGAPPIGPATIGLESQGVSKSGILGNKPITIGGSVKNPAFEATKQESRGPFEAGSEVQELASQKTKALPSPQAIQAKTTGKPIEAKPIEETKISKIAKEKIDTNAETQASLGIKEVKKPEFKEQMPAEEVHDYVLDPITKFNVSDKSKAGQRLKNLFGEVTEYKHAKVNSAYDTSRKINGAYIEGRPQFLSTMESLSGEEKPIPTYGTNADIDRKIGQIKKALVEVDKEGNAVGLKQVSNQDLIELGQDLRKKVQYNYAHDPSNVYYKIINAIDEEILRTARQNPKGYAAHYKAKNLYREWQEKYNNKNVKPYLNASNQEHIKLFEKLTDEDQFNILHPILIEGGEAGKEYSRILRREIVNNKIGKQIGDLSDPKKAPNALRDMQRGIDELTIPLTSSEKKGMMDSAKNISVKAHTKAEIARLAEESEKTASLQAAKAATERTAKLKGKLSKDVLKEKTPEAIWKEMQTVSGMRKIEALIKKKNPENLQEFQRVKRDAGIYTLNNGKIGHGKTRSIESVLESAENVEFLQEAFGKDVVNKWHQRISQLKNYDKRLANYEKEIASLKKLQEKSATDAAKKGVEKTLSRKILDHASLMAKREAISFALDLSPVPIPYSVKRPIIEKLTSQK
jgi:hypothetical protein